MSKLYSQKKTDAVYYFLASAVIIALANWAFNQSIRVLGLFMDDLPIGRYFKIVRIFGSSYGTPLAINFDQLPMCLWESVSKL